MAPPAAYDARALQNTHRGVTVTYCSKRSNTLECRCLPAISTACTVNITFPSCSGLRDFLRSTSLAGAFVALLGCANSPPPVAAVNLELNRSAVSLGGPVEMSIRFDVSPNLDGFLEKQRVLVHFLDENLDLMWTDDHEPPIPTTQWKSGETIEYTRHTTTLMYPYLGNAVVALGLYSISSGERLVLTGDEIEERVYRGAALKFEPQAEHNMLAYGDGWHQAEFDRGGRQQWRWTTGRSVLSFQNPKKDSVLYLHVAGRPDVFDTPQHMTVVVDGRRINKFQLDTKSPHYKEIELRAVDLGLTKSVTIELLVDKTFVPLEHEGKASKDGRELGARVYYAFVEEKPRSTVAPVSSELILPAKPYAALIQSASERHGVDSSLLRAVIEVESGYRANARSPRGAMGLMQLMPGTVQHYSIANPYDPQANVEAGTRHLKLLLEKFGTRGGLAAYNAGEGSVRRYNGVPPYPETVHYVNRVLELLDSGTATDDD